MLMIGLLISGAITREKAKELTVQLLPQTTNNIDRLTQIKKLLDSGIITKKEFEEKKQQILENTHHTDRQ